MHIASPGEQVGRAREGKSVCEGRHQYHGFFRVDGNHTGGMSTERYRTLINLASFSSSSMRVYSTR